MALPRFEYVAPKTIEEALVLMASHGPGLEVIAGGTEITGHFQTLVDQSVALASFRDVPGLKGMRRRGSGLSPAP
jgi:CO/xanthine dehydrogenase FAD-binding subunit